MCFTRPRFCPFRLTYWLRRFLNSVRLTLLVSVRKPQLAGWPRNTRSNSIPPLYVLCGLRLPTVSNDLYFFRTSLVSFTSNGYALPFSYTELSCRTLPEPLHQLRYPPRTSQRNVHLYLLLTSPCSHRSYLISSLSLTFILCFVTPPDSVLHMLLIPHPFPSKTLPFVPSIPTQTLANRYPHSTFHLSHLRLLSTS